MRAAEERAVSCAEAELWDELSDLSHGDGDGTETSDDALLARVLERARGADDLAPDSRVRATRRTTRCRALAGVVALLAMATTILVVFGAELGLRPGGPAASGATTPGAGKNPASPILF